MSDDDELAGSAFDDSPDVSFGPVRDSDTGEIVDEDPTDDVDQRESNRLDSPDLGDDDNGGSGGSSGGSSSSDDDSSTSVVVTGDPGSDEEQTTVGVGDDMDEAQADAAANPDFDASEGTEIDTIEESIGADGAADKDTSSVVVTGGPGTGKPQTVVGQGSTTLEARQKAALNPRFDAAQGDPVDALETGLNRGQGDQTKAQALIQNQGNQVRPSQKRQRQVRQDQQQFQPFQRARKLQSARQKRDQRVQQAKQESGLAGKSLITGVQIMQGGQEFGDKVAEKTVGRLEDPLEDLFNPEIVNERGQTVDNQELEDQFQTDTLENVERRAEGFRDITEDFTSGTATFGSQLFGLGIATPGAVARATQKDTPSLATGAVKGGKLTTKQIREDPSEFLAEEAGEEVGEAAVGALIGGPVGAAVGATPVPEITPSIQTKAVEGERFLRGDLGTQVENERIITKPFPAEGSAQSASFKRKTQQLEDGGRAQQAVRIDPSDEAVTVGQRKETPVTRRDLLRENLDAGKETVDTFLSGNAVGMGPGALLPDETSPNVKPETEPETLPEQDLFKDTESGGDTFVGQVGRPDLQTSPSVEPGLDEGVDTVQDQEPGFDQQPEEQPPIQEPPIEEPVIEQETTPETIPEVFQQPEIKVRPEPEVVSEPRLEPDATPDLGDDSERSDNILGFTDPGADQSLEAAPSVDAILFGETTDENIEDETVFTGFETREVSEDFNLF